jgi:hypothetical protein
VLVTKPVAILSATTLWTTALCMKTKSKHIKCQFQQ